MPSEQPVPVRPRPRKKDAGTNGTHPKPVDDSTLALTHALEDLHIAAKALHLPKMRIDWSEDTPELDDLDPAQKARRAHVESFFADYEGARVGPTTSSLAEIEPPDNPHAFLVGDLIRPGSTVMLAGPPGAAKSWASRQLALACGAGLETFLDRYPIDRALNVLVIDEDNGPEEEWRRDEALLRHLDIPRSRASSVRRVSLEGVQLEHESWQRWLRGQVRLWDLDLVILDPISEMHGGKELREDPSFRAMLAFLKRLKVDFPRLATVIVHHTRKLPSNERSSSRGLEDVRGQWGQTPDVVVMLSPMADRRAKWEVHKRVAHSSLILEQIEKGQPGEGGLKTVADATTAPTQRMQTDSRILAAIDAGAASVEEIRIATELSTSAIYKAVGRLNQAGLITARAPLERLVEPGELVG